MSTLSKILAGVAGIGTSVLGVFTAQPELIVAGVGIGLTALSPKQTTQVAAVSQTVANAAVNQANGISNLQSSVTKSGIPTWLLYGGLGIIVLKLLKII